MSTKASQKLWRINKYREEYILEIKLMGTVIKTFNLSDEDINYFKEIKVIED